MRDKYSDTWEIPYEDLISSWNGLCGMLDKDPQIDEEDFINLIEDTYGYFGKKSDNGEKNGIVPDDLRLFRLLCRFADRKPAPESNFPSYMYDACRDMTESLIWCVERGFPGGFYKHMMPFPVKNLKDGVFEVDMDSGEMLARDFHNLLELYYKKNPEFASGESRNWVRHRISHN